MSDGDILRKLKKVFYEDNVFATQSSENIAHDIVLHSIRGFKLKQNPMDILSLIEGAAQSMCDFHGDKQKILKDYDSKSLILSLNKEHVDIIKMSLNSLILSADNKIPHSLETIKHNLVRKSMEFFINRSFWNYREYDSIISKPAREKIENMIPHYTEMYSKIILDKGGFNKINHKKKIKTNRLKNSADDLLG
jgi:hypothetical protein